MYVDISPEGEGGSIPDRVPSVNFVENLALKLITLNVSVGKCTRDCHSDTFQEARLNLYDVCTEGSPNLRSNPC